MWTAASLTTPRVRSPKTQAAARVYIDVNGNHTNDPTQRHARSTSPKTKTQNFTSHAGTLGLISNNVLVTKNDSSGSPLDQASRWTGPCWRRASTTPTIGGTGPVGLWENMGGYLSSTVGTFGEFDGNSLQLVKGFNTQFNYDARMRNNPPPFFPTTGNQYNIISWQQVSATLE